MYQWCQIDLSIFTCLDIFCLSGLCRLFCCNPLLLSSDPLHPSLPTPLLSPHVSLSYPSCLFSPVIFSFFLIPPFLSHFILSSLLPPHPFICRSLFFPFIPYLFCLSLSCHAFIPPLLSLLSHLIPLSAHPFIHFPVCQFSYFTDGLSETVLPKQCTKCHFQKPTSNSFSSQTPLSSSNWNGACMYYRILSNH